MSKVRSQLTQTCFLTLPQLLSLHHHHRLLFPFNYFFPPNPTIPFLTHLNPISHFKQSNMRALAKPQSPSTLKTIICCSLFLGLAFLVLRSTFSPSSPSSINDESAAVSTKSLISSEKCASTCNKITPSLSEALIHYATSNITPQQTRKEIAVTERILLRKSPCNFLVFGLGYDSPMWAALNHGGRTVFLEENTAWIAQISAQFPTLESIHATYDTKVRESEELMEAASTAEGCRQVVDPRESKCRLALKSLPKEVYEVDWDLIMVDAPTGYHDEAPGRMSAIYTAGLLARNREEGETDVFVHDVNRQIEDKFSKEFLCEGHMVEEEGRLRHFTVPNHRTLLGRPFCPPPKPLP